MESRSSPGGGRQGIRHLRSYGLPILFAFVIFFVDSAYNSQSLLVMEISEHTRSVELFNLISLAYQLGGTALGALSAPFLYKYITVSSASMLAVFTYAIRLHIAIFPSIVNLIPSSIFLSFCATIMLVGMTTKLSEEAERVGETMGLKTKWVLQRFVSLFYCGISLSVGLASLINIGMKPLLKEETVERVAKVLYNTTQHVYCGSFHCLHSGDDELNLSAWKNFTLAEPWHTDKSKTIWITIYGSLCSASCVLLVMFGRFMDARPLQNAQKSTLSCLKIIGRWNYGFILMSIFSSGLTEGFIMADYNRVYVLCSLGRYHLHLTLTVFALSSALTCAVIVCISHRVDRFYIMSATTMIQICVIITLIIWPPVARHIFMFYIVSASLGVCMALWHTQLLTQLGTQIPAWRLQAYANFQIFHGAGYLLAFCVSTYLCMNTKLYFLLGMVIVAQFMYLVCELTKRIERIRKNTGKRHSTVPRNSVANSTISLHTRRSNTDKLQNSHALRMVTHSPELEPLTENKWCEGASNCKPRSNTPDRETTRCYGLPKADSRGVIQPIDGVTTPTEANGAIGIHNQ